MMTKTIDQVKEPVELAAIHSNLSSALGKMHNREAAHFHVQKSVEILSAMTENGHTELHEPLLIALANYSISFSELGMPSEALDVLIKAKLSAEKLIASGQISLGSTYADILNRLANRVAEIGEAEDALALSYQAVQIYRQVEASGDDLLP